tara:strand:- start:89 stop:544 length:456 start_codon:yes stop_codon:yes gene_type:complete
MEFYFYSLFLFFLIDILMYRIKKINFFIDCIIISFPLFVIIQYFLLGYLEVDLNTKILLLSNYIFFLIFYYFVFIGIKKISPTLLIIYFLNKKYSYKKIKKFFLKKKFYYSRLNENIEDNLILKKNNKIFLTNKGKILISIINKFNSLLKL